MSRRDEILGELKARGKTDAEIAAIVGAVAKGPERYSHPIKPDAPQSRLQAQAADVFGVPYGGVDFEGPPGSDRAQLGLYDKAANARKYMDSQHPGGSEIIEIDGQKHIAYQRPDGSVSFANPPGFELGDVPEFYSRDLPAIGGGLMGGVMGSAAGPWGSVAGVAGGASVAETMRRGLLRPAAGGEEIGAADILPIGGIAALEAVGGPVGGRAIRAPVNIAMGKGITKPGQMRDRLVDLDYLKTMEPDIPMPAPTRMGESLLLGQSEKQVGSTTVALMQKEKLAQQRAVELLKSSMGEDAGQVRGEIRAIAADYVKASEAAIRWPLKRTETGGKAGLNAVDNWLKNSRKQVSSAYRTLDDIAEVEKPVFDLSPMKGASGKYKIFAAVEPDAPAVAALLEGPVSAESAANYINVAKDPQGRVARVLQMIDKIAPQQGDYKVLKEMRTQVGDAIEGWPWDADRGTGIAKRVYRDLTNIISNPANGAKGFAAQHKLASSLAKHRFDVLDNQGFRMFKMIGEDSPAKLAVKIAEDPNLITPAVAEALGKKYNVADLDTLRLSLIDRIVSKPGGARTSLKEWWNQNPKQARLIFKGRWAQAQKAASGFDRLNSSRVAKIASGLDDRMNVTKLLVDGLDEPGAKDLVRQFGGAGTRGHKLLRVAAHEGIVDRVLRFTDDGAAIDTKALLQEIEKAKGSGVWMNVFTAGDRARMKALGSYAYLTRKGTSDTGVSLQRAAAVANLRHPATFMKGVHTLSVNRIIGTALANDSLSTAAMKFRLGAGGKPVSADSLNSLGIFAAGVADYWLGVGHE